MQVGIATLAAAIPVALCAAAWILLGSHSRHRRLERLRAQRDAADAEARCVAAFPQVDPGNARAAYRWVQALVEIDDLPLHPGDDLGALLGVEQATIDDRLGAAREDCGPGRDDLAVPRPPGTVQALMAAVLAAGCEFASEPRPSRPPAA